MYQDRKSRMAGRASIQLDSQGPSGLGNLNGLRHGNFDHFVLPKKNYKSKTVAARVAEARAKLGCNLSFRSSSRSSWSVYVSHDDTPCPSG